MVRVPEHKLLCPREASLQRHGSVNLNYTLGYSLLLQWKGIFYKGVTILLFFLQYRLTMSDATEVALPSRAE